MTMGLQFPTERWKKWVEHLEDVKNQINNLVTKRIVWRRYQAFLKAGVPPGNTYVFHQWAAENYGDSMSVGIRRVLDRDTKTTSLYRLLLDIAAHTDEVTIDNYKTLWNVQSTWEGEEAIKAFAAALGNRVPIQRSQIIEEAEALRKKAESILTHTDKRIAHSDPDKGDHALPTWKDLDDALDPLIRTFENYHLLLTCGNHFTEEPIMPFGWDRIFETMK